MLHYFAERTKCYIISQNEHVTSYFEQAFELLQQLRLTRPRVFLDLEEELEGV